MRIETANRGRNVRCTKPERSTRPVIGPTSACSSHEPRIPGSFCDLTGFQREESLNLGIGFGSLIGGVGAIYLGHSLEGAVAAGSSSVLLFIQRVFYKREDVYRALADAKQKHLEYGDLWLLAIQSIDSIEDSEEKRAQQKKLVKAITQKLKKW